MADTSAEKLQNMNIQDFDGSEFDPFSPQNKVANMNNVEQPVDLLGGFVENGQITNGSDKHVSFDQEAGIGLPDPSYINQGQGQIPGFEGQKVEGLQRHMSEGEILGYQNEYGESAITGQMEYAGSSDEENLIDIPGTGVDSYPKGKGYLPRVEAGEYSSPDPSQNLHEQYVENDYAGDNEAGVKVVEETFDSPNDYDNDETDPDSWRPEMDPERLRRSLTPERSVSPFVKSESFGDVDSDMVSSPSEMSHREPVSEPVGVSSDRELSIPKSEGVETPDLVSQGSQQISSEETESLDSRSETDSTPRRRRIPKPKTKKPLELPPWDDNVVIPKPPRMKPTLIGKQADLPPPSPPRFHRPYTAPARHNAKDASSDSGVEDESKSTRKSSGDMKKKYGIDTKNTGYRPGGGNVQVFSQKVDTKSITPRTDTTKPRSAFSPRVSPSKEKSPAIPKAPTPNTKHAQSKIGSLNNVKHSPGGGNVKVLNAKVDFSNVSSKVGSKDKIDHKPMGGDKKIESQKLTWQKESKVGSLKNVTHSPGGGNVKDGQGQGTMNTRENIHYHPGGGNIPDPYEEDLDWDVDAKVNTLDNLDYEPGGGCVKIFSEKLNWKAEPKVDTGLYRRSENVSFNQDNQRYDSTKQQVAITIEPVPDRFSHTFLEPVPEVEYQSAADVKRNQSEAKPVKATIMEPVAVTNDEVDKADDSQTDCDETNKVFGQYWRQEAQPPPPPPKPHRCVHKQWELEKEDESTESNKPYEREILTFTKEELEEILRKKDLDDQLEKEYSEPFKCLDEQNVDKDKKIEAVSEDRRINKLPEDMHVRNITNEEELKNVSVDHKEETFIIEREVIRKLSGKENKVISKKSHPKEKTGFVNKMKSLLSSKGKDENKDRKSKKFSSTSFNINRSSSNSSRISIKGKKLKQCAAEEEKEIELMVKYLGYHSPKLARKSFIEQDQDSGDLNSKQEKKKLSNKKTMEKVEQVEKLANLGYQSPKLADRKGKPIIMTGSPRQKRKAEMDGKGIGSETARLFDNEGDRVGRLGKETATKRHVKEGIHSDYQDIDFGANVLDIKNGKTKAVLSYSNTMSDGKLLLEKESRNYTNGIMNDGYEYDDVASDEDTDHSGFDIEEVSEDERHTSVAEINVNSNRGSKKSIQTTTFKYKMDERPTSPLNEIKQQMIENMEQNLSTVEDRTDVQREIAGTCNMPKAYSRTMHDQFGYAVVHKVENGSLLEKEHFERGMEIKNDDNMKLGESLQNQESCTEAATKSQDIRKSVIMEIKGRPQKKTKPALEDSDHEITLEKELKAVLANIQDNEGNFLKCPRRYEGTETGSRPGTPKIPVKPLWMKAEEEGRYGLRRYMSDENLSRPSKHGFVRSNKTQSMMVRKKGQMGDENMLESGSGAVERKSEIDSPAIKSRDGNNLARSFKMINLSCSEQIKSHSVDDLRQNALATASYKAGNSFSLIYCKNEEVKPVSSSLKSRHVSASENCGIFNSEIISGSVNAGVTQNSDKAVSNSESTVDKRERQEPSHATGLVVNQRLSWSAKSRVGSLDNASHSPGGGKVKILDQKLEIKAQSKIGSTANIKHKPGGGDKKIETQKLEFKETARSKVGSMDKVKHKPGGGDIKIFTELPKWETASKVKSFENAKHVPSGGSVKILDEKVDFTQTAKPKVGSMDKVKHQPGGGDKKIETQKLNFKETAKARTDTGASSGERRSSSDPQGSGSVTSSQDGSVQE